MVLLVDTGAVPDANMRTFDLFVQLNCLIPTSAESYKRASESCYLVEILDFGFLKLAFKLLYGTLRYPDSQHVDSAVFLQFVSSPATNSLVVIHNWRFIRLASR